jgi:N4-gp56 family major capsid protein
MATLNALAPTTDINTWVDLANKAGAGVINPETFYSKQLLDTIRYDADQYVYFRLADVAPIQEKADKLMLRRWAPLQAHTIPLDEGVPPKSDKGSVEKYELTANQYGRYMEFSDKVDFRVVDPVIAHYSREYSLVAMETLDLLAKETLLSVANKFYAGQAANFEALTPASKPSMADLRLIVLALKKALVKPRINGRYHVIGSPEFYYDMISDPIVEKYMTINQSTKTMYDNGALVPMFEMEFYETMLVPTSSEYIAADKLTRRMYRLTAPDTYAYDTIAVDNATYVTTVDGYVKDARTGQDASYIPSRKVWDIAAWNTANKGGGADWYELKAQHILIVGKDALTRTGLSGEDSARMYVKQKGSSGVLDPIDQRQSIGFKINSVGFGSTRLEAIVDYICIPSQVNPV